MNNLMLTFSGVDLSRLRDLVADVAKDVALVPGAATTDASPAPKTALDTSWSRLVAMLDLGTEPEMRTCPECKHVCTLKASRCGHCWTSLLPVMPKEKLAA